MNSEYDDELRAAFGQLPRQIQPQHDLWPGIAARITRGRRASRPQFWAYGLAASLLVAIGAGASWLLLPQRSGMVATPLAQSAAPPATVDIDYLQARAAFAANVTHGGGMSPATRAVILHNLGIIDRSMHDIQGALAQDPNNPHLRGLLFDIYQNEATLLAAAQNAQVQPTTRTDL